MPTRWLAISALGAALLLLWPFKGTAFTAACMACVLYPLHARLAHRIPPTLAAGLLCAGLLLAVVLPLSLVTATVAPQAVHGLQVLDELRESGWFTGPEAQAILQNVDEYVRMLPGLEGGVKEVARLTAGFAGTAVRTALSQGLGLAGGAFAVLLQTVILLLILPMCLLNAEHLRLATVSLTTLGDDVVSRLVRGVRGAIGGVLMGVVFVAIVQGILCGIGFAVAGIPQAAFWALVAACVAPIPVVGTALVWGPCALWLWFTGATIPAAGLALWGGVAVSGVDNLLRPLLLKGGINAPLPLIFLSIICGLAAFGPLGLLAGPVLVAFGLQAAQEGLAPKLTNTGKSAQ